MEIFRNGIKNENANKVMLLYKSVACPLLNNLYGSGYNIEKGHNAAAKNVEKGNQKS